jgi:hypothetical protein
MTAQPRQPLRYETLCGAPGADLGRTTAVSSRIILRCDRLDEVVCDLIEETGGRKPTLVGADQ